MLPVRFVSRFPFGEFTREALFQPLRVAETLLDGFDRGCRNADIDVREEEGRYVIEADLPGYTTDDLDITIDGGVLTLTAQQVEENESKKDNYHVRERRFGKISRSLRLPDDVNTESVNAALKDGVLTVTVEKAESAKPHKIEVTAG